ncbi:MAG TPA: ATP synthase subunit I [Candidatus Aminicenantes bacterium]|nr:ATP synthase subunit I [Candidatus Aminicenantes bacterium]
MTDALTLAAALAAGIAIGMIFFGGLWWTVKKGVSAGRPALWFGGSLVVRMGVAVAGFYFVFDGDWQRLLACTVGFLVARIIVIRLTGTMSESADSSEKQADHAT